MKNHHRKTRNIDIYWCHIFVPHNVTTHDVMQNKEKYKYNFGGNLNFVFKIEIQNLNFNFDKLIKLSPVTFVHSAPSYSYLLRTISTTYNPSLDSIYFVSIQSTVPPWIPCPLAIVCNSTTAGDKHNHTDVPQPKSSFLPQLLRHFVEQLSHSNYVSWFFASHLRKYVMSLPFNSNIDRSCKMEPHRFCSPSMSILAM